jgi:hypothetical protein
LFVNRGFVGQNLSVEQLMSLLLRSGNSPPADLAAILHPIILTDGIAELPASLLTSGLSFLASHLSNGVNSSLLVKLINGHFPPHVTADFVHLLRASDVSQAEIFGLLPLFEEFVFTLDEDLTPVHLAIAEALPLMLFDRRALAFALRLLIDDIPKVRTLAIRAVSEARGTEFCSEVVTFRELANYIAETEPNLLMRIVVRWLGLMEKKAKKDAFGELLTTFVDEVFVLRELFAVLHLQCDFSTYPLDSLINVRKEVIKAAMVVCDANVS